MSPPSAADIESAYLHGRWLRSHHANQAERMFSDLSYEVERLRAERIRLAMHNWNIIGRDPATLPPLGQMVWLYEAGRGPWIGSRDDVDGEGWLWSDTGGRIWHDGVKWDGEGEQDDYHPTHWLPLPEPPVVEKSTQLTGTNTMKTLSPQQLAGCACIVCGRSDRPMVPIYVETPTSAMVFACVACPAPSAADVRRQIARSRAPL